VGGKNVVAEETGSSGDVKNAPMQEWGQVWDWKYQTWYPGTRQYWDSTDTGFPKAGRSLTLKAL
jgi:hypothetical protein